jgi:hypothetical protein
MDPVIELEKVQGPRNESTPDEVLSEFFRKMCLFRVHNTK